MRIRAGFHPEQNPDSKTWTAGIDAFRDYGDLSGPGWHLNAIEVHHKDKCEAVRLRDLILARLDAED